MTIDVTIAFYGIKNCEAIRKTTLARRCRFGSTVTRSRPGRTDREKTLRLRSRRHHPFGLVIRTAAFSDSQRNDRALGRFAVNLVAGEPDQRHIRNGFAEAIDVTNRKALHGL
ncbi:hypothetical protein [Bradyrhizobium prioriisuperbiae]|uniref:hypothetical protein n=1 Tax=Bradyrhizobium prioriisuperbiae TaxID=2854389 RepID=UPI0028EA8E9A|nr:hypothetical protein [Bradyrhizobium prioritasuperba]